VRSRTKWARGRIAVFTVLLSGVFAGGVAAAGVGAGNDRDAAASAVTVLESVPANAALAREPLRHAKHALRRAADARAAGDHTHGAQLEALAREWAESASDLLRAVAVERRAIKAEKRAAEADAKIVRARALLEETLARRGRAQEKLEQLKSGGASAPGAPGGSSPPGSPAASAGAGGTAP